MINEKRKLDRKIHKNIKGALNYVTRDQRHYSIDRKPGLEPSVDTYSLDSIKSFTKEQIDFSDKNKTTPMGFEPTRAEHIGLAVQRLNHSATVSYVNTSGFYYYISKLLIKKNSRENFFGVYYFSIYLCQNFFQREIFKIFLLNSQRLVQVASKLIHLSNVRHVQLLCTRTQKPTIVTPVILMLVRRKIQKLLQIGHENLS